MHTFKTKRPEYLSPYKKEELQLRRRLLLFGFIIVLILLSAYFWGISFLNTLGNFFLNVRGSDDEPTTTQEQSFLRPPQLEPPPTITNKPILEIKGSTSPNVKVKLTLNGIAYSEVDSKDDGTFVFPEVKLKDGDNELKLESTDSSGQSSSTTIVRITLDKTPPKLEVSEPQSGLTIPASQKEARIVGLTEADVLLTINDTQAIINPDGTFELRIPLKGGSNSIKIIAKDGAENQTVVERVVEWEGTIPTESPIPSP